MIGSVEVPVLHQHTVGVHLKGAPGILAVHPVFGAAAVLRPVPREGELTGGGSGAAEQGHDVVLGEVERRH